ncbi:hypothetical protein [Woodsholea maritima]|uniref:hypothetical protein n=1 Tax=Woodsholea maritima TaxID=240237 RepID=UPI000379B565|nr:hypothetical protein [Woodsholea maritima]
MLVLAMTLALFAQDDPDVIVLDGGRFPERIENIYKMQCEGHDLELVLILPSFSLSVEFGQLSLDGQVLLTQDTISDEDRAEFARVNAMYLAPLRPICGQDGFGLEFLAQDKADEQDTSFIVSVSYEGEVNF